MIGVPLFTLWCLNTHGIMILTDDTSGILCHGIPGLINDISKR